MFSSHLWQVATTLDSTDIGRFPHCRKSYWASLSWIDSFPLHSVTENFYFGITQKEVIYFREMPQWRVTWRKDYFPSCTPTPYARPAGYTNPGKTCSHQDTGTRKSCLPELFSPRLISWLQWQPWSPQTYDFFFKCFVSCPQYSGKIRTSCQAQKGPTEKDTAATAKTICKIPCLNQGALW